MVYSSMQNVDYTATIATTAKTSWMSQPLDAPGTYRFAVRSLDTTSEVEEKNVDVVVDLVLNSSGMDVTNLPLPPKGTRVFQVSGGRLRVEWMDPGDGRPSRRPLGYHVYAGTAPVPDYSKPTVVLPWSGGRLGGYSVDLVGLVGGQAYLIGVRAYASGGEEQNQLILTATVNADPPGEVEALVSLATST
jgi:hypothetical protein